LQDKGIPGILPCVNEAFTLQTKPKATLSQLLHARPVSAETGLASFYSVTKLPFSFAQRSTFWGSAGGDLAGPQLSKT